LYRQVTDSRDPKAARNRGPLGQAGEGGPPAGNSWDTPSELDQSTVMSQESTKVYVDSRTDTSTAGNCRDMPFGNPLVAGSSPARPTNTFPDNRVIELI
jgi:hypothetical protein